MKALAVFVGILLVQCAFSEEPSENPSSSSPKPEASSDTKSSIPQVVGNPIEPQTKEKDISIQNNTKEASNAERSFAKEAATTNEKNFEEECAEEGVTEEQGNEDSYDDEESTDEASQKKGKEVTEPTKPETMVYRLPKVILPYYHLPPAVQVVPECTFVTPRAYRGPLCLLPPVYGSHHRRPPVAYVPSGLRPPVKISYGIKPIPMHSLVEPSSINYASYFGFHPPSVGISPPAPQLVASSTFDLASDPVSAALLPPFGIPPIDISPPTIGSEADSFGPELFTAPSPLRVPPAIVEGPVSLENSFSFIPSSVPPPYTSPLPLPSPGVITSGTFAQTKVTPLTYPSTLTPYVCTKVLSSPILRKIPNFSQCFKNYF